MLRVAASQLLLRKSTLSPTSRLLIESKAYYYVIRTGKWPEGITQQTLNQFLRDINYFDEPKEFINIGLQLEDKNNNLDKNNDCKKNTTIASRDDITNEVVQTKTSSINEQKIDEILGMLSIDAEIPALSYDDVKVSKEQLINLAINFGIFRDLFTKYTPNKEHIKFKKEQADKLDKLVPFYWITDMPYARVDRKFKEPEPMPYFEPVIGISARFVHNNSNLESSTLQSEEDHIFAHTVYHGNIIPACDAQLKPSITLDGRLLSDKTDHNNDYVNESKFDNWKPGQLNSVNINNSLLMNKLYSIALVNLDYIHENDSNLHWLISDINLSSDGKALNYKELCDYLPVHGIQGFGYSRYAFLVFMHDSELAKNMNRIEDFSLDKRKFNTSEFIEKYKDLNIKPVGLSWFQTTWDISSNNIFHNYINQQAPIFEHVQEKLEKFRERAYPGPRPFNSYLDQFREKKDINEQVLLERLKNLHPSESYVNQYVPPKVPPTVFVDENIPSWMYSVMFKKKNKIGYWRGLRPVSKLLPLNNNADLDTPLRPIDPPTAKPPGFPNLYPAKLKYRPHKVMPYNKPPTEQQSVFVYQDNQKIAEEAKKIVEELKNKNK